MLASACNPPLPIQHQQADPHAQYRTAQDITGKMHVQVQAGERDEHRQRDGRPAKPPVRHRQDGGTDGPGHRMTGWERVVAGAGDQQWYALVQPAGARPGEEIFQRQIAQQQRRRQPYQLRDGVAGAVNDGLGAWYFGAVCRVTQ